MVLKHAKPGSGSFNCCVILNLIILLALISAGDSFSSCLEKKRGAFDGEKKTVKITSVPAGADIFIDGENYGTTDTEIFLKPGTYVIQLKKESYLTLSSAIEIQERGNEFSFELTPKVGWMDLTVHPSDARVIINDSVYSGFDKKLLGLTPGKNNILIEKPGYLPEHDSLPVIVSDRVIKIYNLTPAPMVQSENNTLQLKYMNLVLNSWDLSNASSGLVNMEYLLRIRDDESVAHQYKGTAKTLLGNIHVNSNNASLELENFSAPVQQNMTEYSVVLKPRSKLKSLVESALCPGLGQINSKRIFTGISFSAAFAGSLIWNALSLSDYYNTKDKLNNDLANYRIEPDVSRRYQLAESISSACSGIDVKRRKANLTLAVITAVYALNILDAVFMTPRVKEAFLEQNNTRGLSRIPANDFSTYSISVININL